MKKNIFILLPILSIMLFSCDNTTHNYDEFEKHIVNDNEIRNAIFNFKLEYELVVPGNQISWNTLWTGMDKENMFGPNYNENNRLNTYLTNYSNDDNLYYFLYLKQNDLENFVEWYDSYQNSGIISSNFHFINDENVVDGKFLLFAQKKNISDYFVYYSNSLNSVPYEFNEKRLALCVQSKTLKVLENVGLNQIINKEMKLLRRFEVFKSKGTNELFKYEFENLEKNNINYVDNIFSYTGNRIETLNQNFENANFCYCPHMGFDIVLKIKRAEFTDGNVILPRYENINGQEIDLLNYDFSGSIYEDVYRDFKNHFLDAFISDYNYSDNLYRYGLFDATKVKSIIFSAYNIL